MIINKDKYEENKNKYNDLCNKQLGGNSKKEILLGIVLFLAFITIKNYIRAYNDSNNLSQEINIIFNRIIYAFKNLGRQ